MKDDQNKPAIDAERKFFINNIVNSCSNPSLYDEESVAFYKRTKWIQERRTNCSIDSEIAKRNSLYNKVDFLNHCFNIFSFYIKEPQESFYSINNNIISGLDKYEDKDNQPDISEWREFPEILTFTEPLLPEDLKLRSVIAVGPAYFDKNYSGVYDKIDGMTIEDYRLYFRHVILPAYIWLWKDVYLLDQKDEFEQNKLSVPDQALSAVIKDWSEIGKQLIGNGTITLEVEARWYIYNGMNRTLGSFIKKLRDNTKQLDNDGIRRARKIIREYIRLDDEGNKINDKTISNNFFNNY